MLKPDPKGLELLKILQSVSNNSDGRLRIKDGTERGSISPYHYMEFDGKPLGRSVESFVYLSKTAGWEDSLAIFYVVMILPLKREVPKVFDEVCLALERFVESNFPKDQHEKLKKLFSW